MSDGSQRFWSSIFKRKPRSTFHIEFPKLDPTRAQDTDYSNAVFDWTVKMADAHIAWYERRIRGQRESSKALRFLSILLTGLGGLSPLVNSLITNDSNLNFQISQGGFLALGIAGLLIAYDKFFGFSAGWMRYVLTRLSLEKALREFQYDWALISTQNVDPKDLLPALVQRAKEFSLQAEILVKQETDSWVLEFQNRIAELDKELREALERNKPGSIKVTVSNSPQFDEVEIRSNNSPVTKLGKNTETLLDSISPGNYVILGIGKKDGKQYSGSKVVEVKANMMSSAELVLSN